MADLGKVRLDVLIGPPRALTSGENLYSLTVRDRYTHTLGHTLLPKKTPYKLYSGDRFKITWIGLLGEESI